MSEILPACAEGACASSAIGTTVSTTTTAIYIDFLRRCMIDAPKLIFRSTRFDWAMPTRSARCSGAGCLPCRTPPVCGYREHHNEPDDDFLDVSRPRHLLATVA